jgi:hypothetical protein
MLRLEHRLELPRALKDHIDIAAEEGALDAVLFGHNEARRAGISFGARSRTHLTGSSVYLIIFEQIVHNMDTRKEY